MVVDLIDPVFGELGDMVGNFFTRKNVVFCGSEQTIEIYINYEDEPVVSQLQRDAFEKLMQGWDEIQHKVAAAILHYYNHGEKFSYGPEDEVEKKQWWPDIENEEDLVKYCHLSSIQIQPEDCIEDQRDMGFLNPIYLLFDRDWGGDDSDANGVCAFVADGEVVEIGYNDIAF